MKLATSRQPYVQKPFLTDVRAGLSRPHKSLPSKYFYDERGSALFERICELPEYYLTRAELSIMRQHARAMADQIGSATLIIELGSGSGEKTILLLENLQNPAGYMPVDISHSALSALCADLKKRIPDLPVYPLHADFLRPFECPRDSGERRVIYFPGSTIGNLSPKRALELLTRMRVLSRGGAMIIGIDLLKDKETLLAAYDDHQGVTAKFNKNVLLRINRELDGTFDLDRFAHQARFNHSFNRIEMHLVSLGNQAIRVGDHLFEFIEGESICTEYSHKYTLERFEELTNAAGWRLLRAWMDEKQQFAIVLLRA